MFKTAKEIVSFTVADLRPDPKQKDIHGDFEPHGRDSRLIADIKQKGVLIPLVVLPNREVKDGHRRLWVAKHLKMRDVPCVVLVEGEDAAFVSAQLSRRPSIYAQCMLHREEITKLIERGQAVQKSTLRVGVESPDREADEQLDGDWTALTEVLGIRRRTLTSGVNLLDAIDSLTDEQPERADKIRQVFRNRGPDAARRMMNDDGQTPDEDTEDEPADCSEWGKTETFEAPARNCTPETSDCQQPKRKGRQPKRKRPATKRKGGQTEPAWQTACFKALAVVQTHLRRNHRLTEEVRQFLDGIERSVRGEEPASSTLPNKEPAKTRRRGQTKAGVTT